MSSTGSVVAGAAVSTPASGPNGTAPATPPPTPASGFEAQRRRIAAGIRRAIDGLHLDPSAVYEMRALNRRGLPEASGYFDDPDALAREGARLAIVPQVAAVYLTLNPVIPALHARAFNRVVRYPTNATSDDQIARRTRLMIDVDPERPAGISSTDAEHDAAIAKVTLIEDWLRARGWPDPIRLDSGNGATLLYGIDMSNDPTATALVVRVLTALKVRFDDAADTPNQVAVDTSVSNAGRLYRLPGTVNRKGDNTPNRPHRTARVLASPAMLKPVPRELLEALGVENTRADTADGPRQNSAAATGLPDADTEGDARTEDNGRSASGQWLDDWIAQHLRPWCEANNRQLRGPRAWGDGGRKWTFDSCPRCGASHNKAFLGQRADGAIVAGCRKASCRDWDWHDLRLLIEGTETTAEAEEQAEDTTARDATPRRTHFERDGKLWWLKHTERGDEEVPLTTFTAKIVGDVREDDGSGEVRRLFEISARCRGRQRQFTIPAADFDRLHWPTEHLGAGAMVYPGFGLKDHARFAIQSLSGDVTERVAYAHTGWRQLDGPEGPAWAFLHAGGAIGARGAVSGVDLRLPGALARFDLPAPPTGDELRAAVRASLAVLGAAPEAVTVPLLAATYRAVLGRCDFGLWIVGPTGAGKSELAALGQQHFGADMTSRALPASWSSTANATEGLAFQAKDAPLVIDDFAPNGGPNDMARLQGMADRLFRNLGNGAGRQRMTASAELRPEKPPRALLIATGEDVPRGQSVRARSLIVEVAPDAVDFERLTARQRDGGAGLYAAAMSGYLTWVAARHGDLQAGLVARERELRALATASTSHRRTPDIAAKLGGGWEQFLAFAAEIGAIEESERADLWTRGWAALGAAAARQGAQQAEANPARRFIDLLGSAIRSGEAHVATLNGTAPVRYHLWGWRTVTTRTTLERGEVEDDIMEARPHGARVGWLDPAHVDPAHADLYLDRAAAFAAARDLSLATGDPLPITEATLTKRLHEAGYLASTGEASGRETLLVRRTIGGQRRNVLHLAATVFDAHDGDEEAA